MLCNARIVSECTYRMIEGRWDILCKKTEAQPVISSWRALHNITCASQEISGANLAGSWKFSNLILYKLFFVCAQKLHYFTISLVLTYPALLQGSSLDQPEHLSTYLVQSWRTPKIFWFGSVILLSFFSFILLWVLW